MHVHYRQEEALTVQEGRIGYQRQGEGARFAEAGETVVFKPGEVHKFWNAGEEDLRCTGYIKPPDNLEYFLTEIFESQRQSGGTRPNPFDAAFLVRRYRSEFGMTEIPAPCSASSSPWWSASDASWAGTRKYADAPEPVSR